MTTLRDALEAALVEDPDDLATHAAYADYLHEQGDPRGELIQTQLALEDEDLPAAERKRLKSRERKLLAQTRAACLGERLAGMLPGRGFEYTVERGWLAALDVDVLPRGMAAALAAAPEARLLRRLALGHVGVDPFRPRDEPDGLALLARSRNLPNLREFRLGTLAGFQDELNEPIFYNRVEDLYAAGPVVWDWLATLPRLEEITLECATVETRRLFALPNLGELLLLQVHLSADYPLEALARNRALRNLTHLSLHPQARGPHLHLDGLTALAYSECLPALTHLRYQRSDAGDDGVRVLLESGLAERLTFLDLAMGTVGDEGAVLLAEAELDNLEVLNLCGNDIGEDGHDALMSWSPEVVRLDGWSTPAEQGEPWWLTAGEME